MAVTADPATGAKPGDVVVTVDGTPAPLMLTFPSISQPLPMTVPPPIRQPGWMVVSAAMVTPWSM